MAHVKSQELGRALRAARVERHFSQVELAEIIGVSERALQGWETGAVMPQPVHRRAILAWLFTETADVA